MTMQLVAPAGEHRPDEVISRALRLRGASDVRFIDGHRVAPEAGFSDAGKYEVVYSINGQPFHGQIICNLRGDPSAEGSAVLTLTATEPSDLADVR